MSTFRIEDPFVPGRIWERKSFDFDEAVSEWADEQIREGDCDAPEWLNGVIVSVVEVEGDGTPRRFSVHVEWEPSCVAREIKEGARHE